MLTPEAGQVIVTFHDLTLFLLRTDTLNLNGSGRPFISSSRAQQYDYAEKFLCNPINTRPGTYYLGVANLCNLSESSAVPHRIRAAARREHTVDG